MARHDRFALVEREGHSERDLFEADDLEEIAEYVAEKSGKLDVGLPEVEP